MSVTQPDYVSFRIQPTTINYNSTVLMQFCFSTHTGATVDTTRLSSYYMHADFGTGRILDIFDLTNVNMPYQDFVTARQNGFFIKFENMQNATGITYQSVLNDFPLSTIFSPSINLAIQNLDTQYTSAYQTNISPEGWYMIFQVSMKVISKEVPIVPTILDDVQEIIENQLAEEIARVYNSRELQYFDKNAPFKNDPQFVNDDVEIIDTSSKAPYTSDPAYYAQDDTQTVNPYQEFIYDPSNPKLWFPERAGQTPNPNHNVHIQSIRDKVSDVKVTPSKYLPTSSKTEDIVDSMFSGPAPKKQIIGELYDNLASNKSMRQEVINVMGLNELGARMSHEKDWQRFVRSNEHYLKRADPDLDINALATIGDEEPNVMAQYVSNSIQAYGPSAFMLAVTGVDKALSYTQAAEKVVSQFPEAALIVGGLYALWQMQGIAEQLPIGPGYQVEESITEQESNAMWKFVTALTHPRNEEDYRLQRLLTQYLDQHKQYTIEDILKSPEAKRIDREYEAKQNIKKLHNLAHYTAHQNDKRYHEQLAERQVGPKQTPAPLTTFEQTLNKYHYTLNNDTSKVNYSNQTNNVTDVPQYAANDTNVSFNYNTSNTSAFNYQSPETGYKYEDLTPREKAALKSINGTFHIIPDSFNNYPPDKSYLYDKVSRAGEYLFDLPYDLYRTTNTTGVFLEDDPDIEYPYVYRQTSKIGNEVVKQVKHIPKHIRNATDKVITQIKRIPTILDEGRASKKLAKNAEKLAKDAAMIYKYNEIFQAKDDEEEKKERREEIREERREEFVYPERPFFPDDIYVGEGIDGDFGDDGDDGDDWRNQDGKKEGGEYKSEDEEEEMEEEEMEEGEIEELEEGEIERPQFVNRQQLAIPFAQQFAQPIPQPVFPMIQQPFRPNPQNILVPLINLGIGYAAQQAYRGVADAANRQFNVDVDVLGKNPVPVRERQIQHVQELREGRLRREEAAEKLAVNFPYLRERRIQPQQQEEEQCTYTRKRINGRLKVVKICGKRLKSKPIKKRCKKGCKQK